MNKAEILRARNISGNSKRYVILCMLNSTDHKVLSVTAVYSKYLASHSKQAGMYL